MRTYYISPRVSEHAMFPQIKRYMDIDTGKYVRDKMEKIGAGSLGGLWDYHYYDNHHYYGYKYHKPKPKKEVLDWDKVIKEKAQIACEKRLAELAEIQKAKEAELFRLAEIRKAELYIEQQAILLKQKELRELKFRENQVIWKYKQEQYVLQLAEAEARIAVSKPRDIRSEYEEFIDRCNISKNRITGSGYTPEK